MSSEYGHTLIYTCSFERFYASNRIEKNNCRNALWSACLENNKINCDKQKNISNDFPVHVKQKHIRLFITHASGKHS